MRYLLLKEQLYDVVMPNNDDSILRKIVIQENKFESAWIASIGSHDSVVLAVDIAQNSRIADRDDGRYYDLLEKLQSHPNLYILTVGRKELIPLTSSVLRNVKSCLNWESLGSKEAELLLRVQLGERRAQGRASGPFNSLSLRNVGAALLIAVLALLIVLPNVQPCSDAVQKAELVTYLSGVLEMPQLERPDCAGDFSKSMTKISTELQASFSRLHGELTRDDTSPATTLVFALGSLNAMETVFSKEMKQALTCNELVGAYLKELEDFHARVDELHGGNAVALRPAKCLMVGKKEVPLPRFFSRMFE